MKSIGQPSSTPNASPIPLTPGQPVTTAAQPDTSAINEPLDRFALWAFDALGIEVEQESSSIYRAAVPLRWQSALEREELRFSLTDGDTAGAADLLTTDSPLFHQIVNCLLGDAAVLHAAPRNQPVSVHEISSKLFDAYTVEDGHVRLLGCTLEFRPLLRITLRQSADRLIHVFTDETGNPVSESLQEDLGLDDLATSARPPIRVTDQAVQKWREVGTQVSSQRDAPAGPLLVTVVWCKYAIGTLLFSIGRQSAEVSFEGWASRFASGREKPPPYQCPHCERSSYHLALTDDRQITAAEAIATCSESGRRVLQSALETCDVTGKPALPEHIRQCPVSGDRVIKSALAACDMCHEQVSPATLRRGRCTACRRMESVTKHEPRIVRLIGEYPALDRWRRWKISETATVYITVATSMLRRLLLVANKQTLEIRRIATGTVPFSTWHECESVQRDELLGTRS